MKIINVKIKNQVKIKYFRKNKFTKYNFLSGIL